MTQSRYYYFDFLRVIAILMMYVYHVSMIDVAERDWHIQDQSSSNVIMEINHWMASFRIPLLFLASGFISVILLERLSQKARFLNVGRGSSYPQSSGPSS